MQKYKIKNSVFIFFIVLLSLSTVIPDYRADLISINRTGTGNLFPDENCSLIMTNASVIFDIYYLEQYNEIFIRFNGNYTIYNPDTSQNLTIAAPFSSEFENLESTCVIKVDNDSIPFTYFQYHWSDPWAEYLDSVTSLRSFVLTNITFLENSSTKIEYSFAAYIIQPDSDDRLNIYYDVGTSRAWNGSITERVEFKAHKKLPNSYSTSGQEISNVSCTVSNISDGRTYTWEWVNETIMIDSVYISYSYPYRYFWGRITPIIIFGCYFGVPIIIAVIIKLRKKRKKRLRVDIMDNNSG